MRMPVLIFILVVCLALGSFAYANDALASYEHNRYLVEAERSNQIQIHETAMTQREALNAAVVSEAVEHIMAQSVSADSIAVDVQDGEDEQSAILRRASELGGQAAQSSDGSQKFIVISGTAYPVIIQAATVSGLQYPLPTN